LDERLKQLDRQISDAFHTHPQAVVIESMPGSAPSSAPSSLSPRVTWLPTPTPDTSPPPPAWSPSPKTPDAAPATNSRR
jgi:hypothetical protein